MRSRVSRLRAWLLVPVLVLGSGTILSACGGGTGINVNSSVVKSACAKVNADLSDGPDPDADPVGYAEAQIMPLGQIKTTDTDLQTAIKYLDSTYRLFYETNGAPASKRSVNAALELVGIYCPGVGS
jgi:hypothetical protein